MQELITCMANTIREPILDDIRKSPAYSVLIDETTDVSVSNQMIVYIRYIDGKNEVTVLILLISMFLSPPLY